MKKIFLLIAATVMALPMMAAQPNQKAAKKKVAKKEVKASKKWNHEQVVELITKVNNYWQANNKPEVRAFWDNAAYRQHGGVQDAQRPQDARLYDSLGRA